MTQDSWRAVRDKVEGLGLKLKLHLEQEQDLEVEPEQEQDPVQAPAMEDLGNRLQEAVAGLGNASKDPAVRADLKDLGNLLRDAIMETATEVGAKVDETVADVKNRKRVDDEDPTEDT